MLVECPGNRGVVVGGGDVTPERKKKNHKRRFQASDRQHGTEHPPGATADEGAALQATTTIEPMFMKKLEFHIDTILFYIRRLNYTP